MTDSKYRTTENVTIKVTILPCIFSVVRLQLLIPLDKECTWYCWEIIFHGLHVSAYLASAALIALCSGLTFARMRSFLSAKQRTVMLTV